MVPQPFKTCTMCSRSWTNRADFLTDPRIELAGYQAVPTAPEQGIFVFQHLLKGCGTSIALRVSLFSDLYNGPKHVELAYRTSNCEQHCGTLEDLRKCSAPCSAAYVRLLIQSILQIPKAPTKE